MRLLRRRRSNFNRSFGAFRNGSAKGSKSVLGQVLGGNAISKSNPKDVEFCFGGSIERERHFEIEQKNCRVPLFEEVLGGSAISKSNQKGFEIYCRGSPGRERHFEIEPESFEIAGHRFFKEVSGETVVSKSQTRLALKVVNL